ncbi:TlpA family protein disulfide reductase, partial [Shewanella sp. SR41-2]|nr:TlpA family protein disulfide reductase [Shewanella sp. SR41-2]
MLFAIGSLGENMMSIGLFCHFRNIKFIALSLAIGLGVNAQAQAAPSLEHDVLDQQGASVSLQQFAGKVVYVDFWASWCAPCRK